VTIVNDGTESNDDRLGAVADIRFVVESLNISTENILIVAGDTLFFREFSLRHFVEKFNKLQEILPGRSLIVNCPVLGNQLLSGMFLNENEKYKEIHFCPKTIMDGIVTLLLLPRFWRFDLSKLTSILYSIDNFELSQFSPSIAANDFRYGEL
jgi:hypothetical protein